MIAGAISSSVLTKVFFPRPDDIAANIRRVADHLQAHHLADTPEQADEAARQFAGFIRRLNGLNPNELQVILPGFHDLESRFRQFTTALKSARPERRKAAADQAAYRSAQRSVVDQYRQLLRSPEVKPRL